MLESPRGGSDVLANDIVNPSAPDAHALHSVHTTSFAQLLTDLGISLVVSTYQAGKLIVLRADSPCSVNTHFESYPSPMGVAVDRNRVAVGTARDVREFHNVPAVAAKLDPAPPHRHDAAFLPRTTHVTGNVQIHEMTWVGDELWFANTRFSCLCTRAAAAHSFVPRWRPRFISELAPEDRCHLNGLACVDGRVRFVTALGETDTAGGWRANKKDGGILIDTSNDVIVARGLSMPHSPRWHQGKLWVLESGRGGVGIVDQKTGRVETIARLPGFTRGFDFHGPFAFIGLSQVRESAHFSGLEITELPVDQRACGVWVIDLRTGQTIAFLRFTDAVQEIFAVQVLHGFRYPAIVEDEKVIADSFILPDASLADVAGPLRTPADKPAV